MRMEVEAIENGGGQKIEAAFIQSEEHRPNRYSPSTDDDVKIPIIDLEKSSPEEVEKACKDWGFFHLINHGLPTHLLRRLESSATDFFSLPVEEKRKVSKDAQNPFGYFDSELTKNVRDWREVFDFVPREVIQLPQSSNPDDTVTQTVTNQWPHHPPDFREACMEYAEAGREISVKLLELIARSLGLPGNRLNEYFRDDISYVRLNCYPECPAPELALGLGRHKDGGGLTLLYQDQVWSNERYESVEHRVVVNDRRRRLSIPFFFNPSQDVMVKPLEELVSEEDPPKYREYNWGKFYKRRKDGNIKNLGVENLQIYHFRI